MELVTAILGFMERGGFALWLIAATVLVMWTFIFERIWYYHGKTGLAKDVQAALDYWESRPERKSWNAHQIREMIISQVSMKIDNNLDLIKTLVSLCPLLGLFGTVTGMIEVFNVLSSTGGGEIKSMASGVSKATLPTLAGMVAALSGIFGNTYVAKIAAREDQLLEDHMTMDH